MQCYEVIIENCTTMREEFHQRINEIKKKELQKIIPIHLIFNEKIENESLFSFCLEMMNCYQVLIYEISFGNNETIKEEDILVLGDIEKNTSIFTNYNITIIGCLKGNIISSKEIKVHANQFDHATLVLKDTILHKTNSKE